MISTGEKEGKPQIIGPVKILLLENNSDDERLYLSVLEKSKLDARFDVAKTRLEFVDRIRAAAYDVVLSDYALSGWTGVDAFNFLRNEKRDIPFILVTDPLGEEKAIECVKNGMADYIWKDRLGRLPSAILRILREKRRGNEYHRPEQSLRESEEKFRILADTIHAAIFIEQSNRCCYVNRAAEDITGYSREELLAMRFSQLIHPDARAELMEHEAMRLSGGASLSRYEMMTLRKNAQETGWLEVTDATIRFNGQPATLTTALDVTERKRLEHDTAKLRDPLTGVASRQRLIEIFSSEAMRTDRTGRPFSLLFLTLNEVRHIIGKYGQRVASRALCRFARTMQLHSRSLDMLARVGADGFAFVLPETPADGAMILGRRIATRLANDKEEPALSCAFVAATYPQDGKTFDDLFELMGRQVHAG